MITRCCSYVRVLLTWLLTGYRYQIPVISRPHPTAIPSSSPLLALILYLRSPSIQRTLEVCHRRGQSATKLFWGGVQLVGRVFNKEQYRECTCRAGSDER